MLRSFFALSCIGVLTALLSVAAMAAPPPPADLQVLAWQGSASPVVESPYLYTTSVQNIGGSTAQGVKIVVEFPLTNSTPSQILGKLSGLQTGCSVISNKLTCNVGSLAPNQTASVTFTFEFQVATGSPTLKSAATTTTAPETNPANNSLSLTPVLDYPDNIISSARVVIVGCAGRGLTSFYQCELAPSSQTPPYLLDLNLGGTTTLVINPAYMGFWNQSTLPNKSLHFTISGGTSNVSFNGYATSSTCFEGVTTFPGSTSTMNAAYRVCRQ